MVRPCVRSRNLKNEETKTRKWDVIASRITIIIILKCMITVYTFLTAVEDFLRSIDLEDALYLDILDSVVGSCRHEVRLRSSKTSKPPLWPP